MGYTTDFTGSFAVTPKLKEKHLTYLSNFSNSRRMKRNVRLLNSDANKDVGLGLGEDGGYYVHSEGKCYWEQGPAIVDYNSPPAGQPGLWCQWVPSEDGASIEWDGGEKFYNYVEWIEYLIEHFLEPWGYKLNGEVEWQGEDGGDFGEIAIEDNIVRELSGFKTYREVR
jgi:hypothetical protein